jgi:uncharacterized repeat protein (TIGR01451 family)
MRQFLPHIFAFVFAAAAASPGLAQDAQKDAVPPPPKQGILKVCKIGGPGIPAGTPFTVTAGSATVTIPSGGLPGGNCVVVGTNFQVGTQVGVTETIPVGQTVSNIDVAPSNRQVGPANLPGGTVTVAIGTGVTEVTFTDKRTGFLEICKAGEVTGNFNFTVTPGGLGPFSIPAGACSHSIEVAAGQVVIHEQPSAGSGMSGCSTLPPTQQGPCNTTAQTSTVTVDPGDVSTETIAYIHNKKNHLAASVGKKFVKGEVPERGTFVVTVKNDGDAIPAGTPITVTDTVPAGVKLIGFSGSSGANWSCTPAFAVTGPATLTCKYTGAYPINVGATLPDLALNASLGQHPDDAKNCATVSLNGGSASEGGQPACAPF